jgi:hypothetical protein
MYLGQKSILMLSAFIDGYQYALHSFEISDHKSTKFDDFRNWVIHFYKAGQYSGGWHHLILDNCNDDDQKALDIFFELYDRFKSETKL